MTRIGIGIIALLLAGTMPSVVAAKNRPAGQGSIQACLNDPGANTKSSFTPGKSFSAASCCYDDGCWSCTRVVAPDGSWDDLCTWLPAPLVFPAQKFPQFNRSDTLEPGTRTPRKQYEAPPTGGTGGVLIR